MSSGPVGPRPHDGAFPDPAPGLEELLREGRDLLERGAIRAAEERFEQVVRLGERVAARRGWATIGATVAEAHLEIAGIREIRFEEAALDHLALAEERFAGARPRPPERLAHAAWRRGHVLFAWGRPHAEALADLDRAAALLDEPGAARDPVLEALIHRDRGNVLLETARLEEARAAFDRSRYAPPHGGLDGLLVRGEANVGWAVATLRLGQPERAFYQFQVTALLYLVLFRDESLDRWRTRDVARGLLASHLGGALGAFLCGRLDEAEMFTAFAAATVRPASLRVRMGFDRAREAARTLRTRIRARRRALEYERGAGGA